MPKPSMNKSNANYKWVVGAVSTAAVVLGGAGYFAYSQFFAQQDSLDSLKSTGSL
jgi:hypothetical protein